jgi:hypothetical protein
MLTVVLTVFTDDHDKDSQHDDAVVDDNERADRAIMMWNATMVNK